MSGKNETTNPCVPVVPVEDVEGTVIDSSREMGMFTLKLEDGTTAYLSWYDVSDDDYLRTDIGTRIQARLDRRERAGDQQIVVLAPPAVVIAP